MHKYKNIPSMVDFVNESERLDEKILLKVGSNYDVFDRGDMDWREAMEYIGYDKNEKEHFFRAWNGPQTNSDVTIMSVSKKDEMKDIK